MNVVYALEFPVLYLIGEVRGARRYARLIGQEVPSTRDVLRRLGLF